MHNLGYSANAKLLEIFAKDEVLALLFLLLKSRIEEVVKNKHDKDEKLISQSIETIEKMCK